MFSAVAGVKFKVATLVPLAQLLEFAFNVATTQEVVLNICNLGALSILVPIPLNRIVGRVLCATNEYQTSGDAAVPQNALIPAVAVEAPKAVLSVPGVRVQDVPETMVWADPQASLAGCAKETKGQTYPNIKSKAVLKWVRNRTDGFINRIIYLGFFWIMEFQNNNKTRISAIVLTP